MVDMIRRARRTAENARGPCVWEEDARGRRGVGAMIREAR